MLLSVGVVFTKGYCEICVRCKKKKASVRSILIAQHLPSENRGGQAHLHKDGIKIQRATLIKPMSTAPAGTAVIGPRAR